MRRSRSVLVLGFLVTMITVTAIASFMVFVTVYRKPDVGTLEITGTLVQQKQEDDINELLDHHRSHSKPGPFYEAIDVLDNGSAPIALSGEQSHTHYVDEGPPVIVGEIVSYLWFDNTTHKVLGTSRDTNVRFSVGDHVVGLTVVDNTRDTHTAYTSVVVKDSNFLGIYCYYYQGAAGFNLDIKQGSRPVAASSNTTFAFESMKDFPLEIQNRFSNSTFLARCVFQLETYNVTQLAFDSAGNTRLIVNGTEQAPNAGGAFVIKGGNTAGISLCQLIYTSPGGGRARLVYKSGLGDSETSKSMLRYNFAKVLPVITRLDPESSTRKGGGRVNILGTSLNTAEDVLFGGVKAKVESIVDDGTSITVIVPNADKIGIDQTTVVVRNRNGDSNRLPFEFDDDTGVIPIKFEKVKIDFAGYNRKVFFDRLSGIKYGPDHRFYATSLSSHVISFELDDDFKVTGKEPCYSPSLGQNKKLMGLAFNYANSNFKLYVSSSVLYWKKENLLSGPKAWFNGYIHILEKGPTKEECLVLKGEAITGLPVSNHDHGVNGLVFDDDGKLHIQVGGFTNAGVKLEDLGGVEENPLSGASLIADVEHPSFFGKLDYAPLNPGSARQKKPRNRPTVDVYMAGFRNSFGINIHSNGNLYATDNGPSMGYGDKSMTCKTSVPFKEQEERYNVDKLHLVTKGAYGGHPNRNRGRDNKYECKFYSTKDGKEAGSNYQPPIATLKSSTDGVVEYVANSFNKRMKHDLVLTMFAPKNSQGTCWRVVLDDENGKEGVKVKGKPEKFIDTSGLAVELTPHGGLIMTRVHRGDVVVFKPVWKPKRMVLTNVMPNRGSSFGKNEVKITGLNIGKNPTAFFGTPTTGGTNKCTKVKVITPGKSFFCTVPPTSTPGQRVVVYLRATDNAGVERTWPLAKDVKTHGYDYKYLKPRT